MSATDNSDTAVSSNAAPTVASSDRPCVLLAANGSAEAQAALRFAAALASREELLLRVLTVLEPLPPIPAQPAALGWHLAVETNQGERIMEIVRAELKEVAKRPSTLTCTLVGNPGATIAAAAGEWNTRYVILGAGRHGAVERFFTGDTVIRVMRHAASPVIAVPPSCGALPRNGIVATDFSEASLAAARGAANVIGEGVLHLLHVRPVVDIPATDPSAWAAVYESGAQSLMAKLAAELESSHPGVRTTTTILCGHVATVLLDYAGQIAADLIAVGQHGHGAMDRFLFGTVAQSVVRAARCAVLVAPPAGK